MIEIDHEAHEFTEFQMHNADFNRSEAGKNIRGYLNDLNGISPTKESITARLSAPVTSNRIDMEKICFERGKSGIWGWRSDKTESINGYDCKVYAASNVEFVTRTRTEHLDESQAQVSIELINIVSFGCYRTSLFDIYCLLFSFCINIVVGCCCCGCFPLYIL